MARASDRSVARLACASRFRWRRGRDLDGLHPEEAARRGGDQDGGDAHGDGAPQWTAAGADRGRLQQLAGDLSSDEQLTALVVEAIAHNPNLQIGAARMEQALLYAKLAGARLYPSVDLLARGGGKLSGDQSGLQGAC